MPPYAELIGDPVAHSKSPDIHLFWLEALGIHGDYGRRRVEKGGLASYFAERLADPDWQGCNVTAPLKEAVLGHLDTLSAEALAVGAVNLVRNMSGKLVGDNKDRAGIAEAIPPELVEGKSILLLGAGGAASAAMLHLLRSRAAEVRLAARSLEKAQKVAAYAGGALPIRIVPMTDLGAFAGADGLVNATPLGMAHAPMPAELIQAVARLAPGAFVFDMVYAPLETHLLKEARRSGHFAIDGLSMLVGQADPSFQAFFGRTPPRSRDAELRRELERR